MKTTYALKVALTALVGVTAIAAQPAWAMLPSLSRGHNILLERGLQIQALSFPDYNTSGTGDFNVSRWAESHFTAIHFWKDDFPISQMPGPPGVPWGLTDYYYYHVPPTADLYRSSLVSYQFRDEQNIADPTESARLTSAMASFHINQPNVITYTNQYAGQISNAAMRTYTKQSQPDMLCFDLYPFQGNLTGGSPTAFYAEMQRYRLLGLAGNDGTGTKPIPVALYTQTFAYTPSSNNSIHVVSESEIRLNNFSAWAFGYKFVDSFVYETPEHDASLASIMFSGHGTSNPTPQFHQIAETNRQSLNLGPALVRLISTDVFIKMGAHAGGALNALPSNVSPWTSGAIPYITNTSVANLGVKNSGFIGDVLLGSFKPLDSSFTNSGHANDTYFMIVNGLSDASGSAADCRQLIHLTFDFGSSGINGLLRLSRDTGQVERVNLNHGSGSQYSLDLYIDGGTGDLFKFDNGGVFVVPEPETLTLLVAGALGSLGYGWRSRR